jgi:hypothetical protein
MQAGQSGTYDTLHRPLVAESSRSGFPKSTDLNDRSWGKLTFEGRIGRIELFQANASGVCRNSAYRAPATKTIKVDPLRGPAFFVSVISNLLVSACIGTL